MEDRSIDREWKKGSAELLLLSLLEALPRHGYEIGKLIEQRSQGALRFHAASLYPLLYRLEKRGWIQGRWVEKSGQRRRRYYRLTRAGTESPGFPAARLADVRGGHQPHHGSRKCLTGMNRFASNWRT